MQTCSQSGIQLDFNESASTDPRCFEKDSMTLEEARDDTPASTCDWLVTRVTTIPVRLYRRHAVHNCHKSVNASIVGKEGIATARQYLVPLCTSVRFMI